MLPARVRTALFTPGSDPSRLRTAVRAGADICIFDLEDSVESGSLRAARTAVAEATREMANDSPICVRIHGASSSEMTADLAALPLAQCSALVIPKVSGTADLDRCREEVARVGGPTALPLIPIVESAAGALHAPEIAASRDVAVMAFGRFDLAADLGIDSKLDTPALIQARAATVLGSRVAHLIPPLDSPWLSVQDLGGLRQAAQKARRDGFGGMLLIHPSHIPVVHEVFRPSSEEIAWARSVLSTASAASQTGRGAFVSDGEMVDEAILRRARGILEQAETP